MTDAVTSKTKPLAPAVAERIAQDAGRLRPRVALMAASLDIVGGQGVQARALVECLQADGHEVAFVPINPAFPRGFRWLRRYPYIRTLFNEALYLASLRALRRAEVVHVFSASYWSFLLAPVPALLVARALGKRTVLNYHSGEAPDHLAHWGRLVHPWLRLADEIVVPSEYLQGVFAQYGYRARVIRNIVDTSRFRYRERVPLRPRLLCARNFEPHYRVDVVLEAFVRLRARYPQATLTLAGYGSEEERLRRLAAACGAGGIRFAGRVEPAAMPAYYDAADIFVNASIVDNQPVSVLEAFAAGLPVVSTETGDIGNMVRDGETGVIVPRENPMAMADAIAGLLEDSASVPSIARRARQEVEKYTWAAVRGRWLDAYLGTRS